MKSLTPRDDKATPAEGKSLVNLLVKDSKLFLFSYSIEKRSLLFWSDNAEQILGVKDIAIARDANLFLRHVHPDDRFALLTELEEAFRGEGPYRATYRWIRPDTDETRWLHCRASLHELQNEKTLDGIIMDLSEEFTGEMSRMAGPDSVQTLLAALPTLVFTIDRDLRVLRINRADGNSIFNFGDEKFRFNDVRIGRPLFNSFGNQDLRKEYEEICRTILDGKLPHHSRRIALEDTVFALEMAPLADKDAIHGILLTVSDISTMVKLEREMATLQRAEGLRLLAAGVAHNFNNTLQGILGHAAILSNHSDNKIFVEKAGLAISDLVHRASELTKQLLAYQHDNTIESESLDVNTVVMTSINAVEDLFNSGMKVAVTFGNPDKVSAKRGPLTEAIVAIVKNAKEALTNDPRPSKSLAIKTGQVQIGDYEVSGLPAGTYTKISISDSGTGMESETLKRCFEPFFTTKERDAATGVGIKPSGLGLSKAFSNIRDIGGTVSIESAKEVGTTVAIYLPVSPQLGSETPKVTPIRRRSPDILIIDDDHMVLDTVQTLITDLGYTCVTADDAAKAYNLLKQFGRSIKLVLLDAMMPTTDGATVLRGLKRINSNIKVIGFSGATPQQTAPMIREGALQILQKPVGHEELKHAIEKVLSSSSPSSAHA